MLFRFRCSLCLILASIAWASPSIVFGQSDSWEGRLISRHVVGTLNLNVGRMCETFEGSEALVKMSKYLEQRKGLDINKVDQFQAFFVRDPRLELGADDNSHTQLTMKAKSDFDAEAVGKLSGYSLAESKLGERTAFLSTRKRNRSRGVWEAILVSDRSLIFGVNRMLNSIIDSQELDFPQEHQVQDLRKDDVDCCVTLSGGKEIAEIFTDVMMTDEYTATFDLFDRGLIYFDGQSESALVGEFHSASEEAAKQLEVEIKKLVQLGQESIEQIRPQLERQLKSMKKLEGKGMGRFIGEVQAMHDSLDIGKEILSSLVIAVDGKQLKIVSQKIENLKALIELFFNTI